MNVVVDTPDGGFMDFTVESDGSVTVGSCQVDDADRRTGALGVYICLPNGEEYVFTMSGDEYQEEMP